MRQKNAVKIHQKTRSEVSLRHTFFINGVENTKMLHTQKQNEEFGITSHSTKISRTREDSWYIKELMNIDLPNTTTILTHPSAISSQNLLKLLGIFGLLCTKLLTCVKSNFYYYVWTKPLLEKGVTSNGKFSTWAPLPTLKFYLRTAPGSPTVSSSSISVFKFYLRLQSSNSIFDFSLQILSSTSIFALLSPDCHFKFMKLVEKVQN